MAHIKNPKRESEKAKGIERRKGPKMNPDGVGGDQNQPQFRAQGKGNSGGRTGRLGWGDIRRGKDFGTAQKKKSQKEKGFKGG